MPESHLLQSVAQTFYGMDLEYATQILAALFPMILTVTFHGLGMDIVRRFFKHVGRPFIARKHVMRREIVMSVIVAIILVSHFSGIAIWAFIYMALDIVPNTKEAMLFSMQNYTTLGSNLVLPGRWTGFGGFEAMTGMLMFGWSTAILATVAQKLHSIDN